MIKVLVVDDSALMRRLLAAVFSEPDRFAVAFARDGQEALRLVAEFEPDVVTLDVVMPQMDGLHCLDRIMIENPCPVVMISALTEDGADITLRALSLGAVDFIAKPGGAMSLRMDELAPLLRDKVVAAATAKLRGSLRLTERVRLRARGAAPPASRPPLTDEAGALAARGDVPGLVLVGASTGGPPALDALLRRLPADFPWPIVVAQHMPASFTGPLARRLDGLCALPVAEVIRPVLLEPGHVYVGRGDADVVVSRRLHGLIAMAAPSLPEHRWHPSVDRLVTTAMAHLPCPRLIGILMTGMGNDGAVAMTQLRAGGGHTIAEAQATAVVWGMPGELVRANGAERVVRLGDIADTLLGWVA